VRLLLPSALFATLGLAQTAPPTFEAAVIKPSITTDGGSSWRIQPGRIVMENETLRQMIQQAYGLQDYQYSGPVWLENDRYYLEGKAETKDPNQLILMLQNLLTERFKLAVHREPKPVSGYALVVAKSGLKIKPAEGEGWNFNSNKTRIRVTHANMTEFAKYLSNEIKQPVVDETGVKDAFTFELQYANPRESSDTNLPTIFTALTEQLGLKLEPRKVPVEILIVDHVERPIL
jgi:uncharacterized protein (TIGR03435 family)